VTGAVVLAEMLLIAEKAGVISYLAVSKNQVDMLLSGFSEDQFLLM